MISRILTIIPSEGEQWGRDQIYPDKWMNHDEPWWTWEFSTNQKLWDICHDHPWSGQGGTQECQRHFHDWDPNLTSWTFPPLGQFFESTAMKNNDAWDRFLRFTVIYQWYAQFAKKPPAISTQCGTPPVISWFITPSIRDISSISPSYWSYKPT